MWTRPRLVRRRPPVRPAAVADGLGQDVLSRPTSVTPLTYRPVAVRRPAVGSRRCLQRSRVGGSRAALAAVSPSSRSSPTALPAHALHPRPARGARPRRAADELVAAAAALPPGFTETVAFSGLTNADGRALRARRPRLRRREERPDQGVRQPVGPDADGLSPTSARKVHDFWDRGLLGLALDPNFPTNPYVYVALRATTRRRTRRHRAALGRRRARRPPGRRPTTAASSAAASRG